ncbi:hypothetical protein ACA910_022061 [Epithemia clementina (nom. ined.)]
MAKGPLKLPSVFSSTKYVRRRLTQHELGKVLDFPLSVTKGKDTALLSQWLDERVPTPFKVCSEVVQRIGKWSMTGYCLTPVADINPETKLLCPPADQHLQIMLATALPLSSEGHDVGTKKHGEPGMKATKSDDAKVSEHLWDLQIKSILLHELSLEEFTLFVNGLRKGLHRFWARNVTRKFWEWWRNQSEARAARGLVPCKQSFRCRSECYTTCTLLVLVGLGQWIVAFLLALSYRVAI